jgi:hypothetical protein
LNDTTYSQAKPGTIYSPFCANESEYVKQKFLFTALCVAGKNAKVQQQKVDTFCDNIARWSGGKPVPVFELLSTIPAQKLTVALDRELRAVQMGQYTRLIAAVTQLCGWYLDDSNCFNVVEREALILVPGIGMKTASFYLLNTRENYVCAVLDTHILRWLRNVRNYRNAPTSTPGDACVYKLWESVYFGEMFKEGYTIKDTAMFDLQLWKAGAGVE